MKTYLQVEKIMPCRNDTQHIGDFDMLNIQQGKQALKKWAIKDFDDASYWVDVIDEKTGDIVEDTILLNTAGYEALFSKTSEEK